MFILDMSLGAKKAEQELVLGIFPQRTSNTPDSSGSRTNTGAGVQSKDRFFPSPNGNLTPQRIITRAEVRLVNQVEAAGIPKEQLFKPSSTTQNGKPIGEYLDAEDDEGNEKYELQLIQESRVAKPGQMFIDDSKSAEFYQEMLERMQEEQGMSRVWTIMSFANIIPKSVLIALGGLATSHENPFVRSLAGSLMPTVAEIARKVALFFAKKGNTEYARELMQAVSSLSLAQCNAKSNEDCRGVEESGHEYANDSDIRSIFPNGEIASPTGFHVENFEKVAIIDKGTGEIVDYVNVASLDYVNKNDCEESCYVVQIVNENINNTVAQAEEALSQANHDSALAQEKKDNYMDANVELNIVKAKKAKTKDPKEQAQLDQREAQLQQTIFYNA